MAMEEIMEEEMVVEGEEDKLRLKYSTLNIQ
jgi:hypothetical protein